MNVPYHLICLSSEGPHPKLAPGAPFMLQNFPLPEKPLHSTPSSGEWRNSSIFPPAGKTWFFTASVLTPCAPTYGPSLCTHLYMNCLSPSVRCPWHYLTQGNDWSNRVKQNDGLPYFGLTAPLFMWPRSTLAAILGVRDLSQVTQGPGNL